MFSKISIVVKFGLIGLIGCALLGAILGTTSVVRGQAASQAAAEDRLTTVANARALALESYLGTIQDDINVVATNPNTLTTLRAFRDGWRELGSNAAGQLTSTTIRIRSAPRKIWTLPLMAPPTARLTALIIPGSANSCASAATTISSFSM